MCFVWCCLIGEALNGFVVVVLFLAFSFCHLCLWGLWLPKPALYFPTSFFDKRECFPLDVESLPSSLVKVGRWLWKFRLIGIRFWTPSVLWCSELKTALLKKRIDSVFDPQVSLFILQILPHHWVSCWLHPLQLCLHFSMIKKPVSGLGM